MTARITSGTVRLATRGITLGFIIGMVVVGAMLVVTMLSTTPSMEAGTAKVTQVMGIEFFTTERGTTPDGASTFSLVPGWGVVVAAVGLPVLGAVFGVVRALRQPDRAKRGVATAQ